MAAHDHGPFRPASVHPAFTLDALRRAWRKVRAAGGGAGADGVAPSVFEQRREAELLALHVELSTGRYRPGPIRRLFIPKADGGVRPLVVWTLRDRVAQRAVHDYLEPCFEAVFLDCSHGYRPGRSVSTAVRAVVAGRDRGLRWALDADIQDCFGRIDPDRVLGLVEARVPDAAVITPLRRWLAVPAPDVTGRVRPVGVAQGGVLSPLLSNVYLHGFDRAMTGGDHHLVRYADDLICLTRRRRDAEAARQRAAAALHALGLDLHPGKTQVVHIDSGFVFLGVRFLGNQVHALRPSAGQVGSPPDGGIGLAPRRSGDRHDDRIRAGTRGRRAPARRAARRDQG